MHHNYQVMTDASGKVTDFAFSDAGDRQADADGIADNDYPVFTTIQEVLPARHFLHELLSQSGSGAARTNFNGSFQNTHDEGVIYVLKGFRRQNFRLNVDQRSPRRSISAGRFYGRSTTPTRARAPASSSGMRLPRAEHRSTRSSRTPVAGSTTPRSSRRRSRGTCPTRSTSCSSRCRGSSAIGLRDVPRRLPAGCRLAHVRRRTTATTRRGSTQVLRPLGFANSAGSRARAACSSVRTRAAPTTPALTAATNWTLERINNTTKVGYSTRTRPTSEYR